MNTQVLVEFPCISYHKKSKKIYYVHKKDWGVVSTGGEAFYKNLILIDSNGRKFMVKNYKLIGFASFINCLLSLQLLKKLEIEVEYLDQLSFDEVKQIIIEYLKYDKSFVSAKYSGIPILDELNKATSVTQLIEFIK